MWWLFTAWWEAFCAYPDQSRPLVMIKCIEECYLQRISWSELMQSLTIIIKLAAMEGQFYYRIAQVVEKPGWILEFNG